MSTHSGETNHSNGSSDGDAASAPVGTITRLPNSTTMVLQTVVEPVTNDCPPSTSVMSLGGALRVIRHQPSRKSVKWAAEEDHAHDAVDEAHGNLGQRTKGAALRRFLHKAAHKATNFLGLDRLKFPSRRDNRRDSVKLFDEQIANAPFLKRSVVSLHNLEPSKRKTEKKAPAVAEEADDDAVPDQEGGVDVKKHPSPAPELFLGWAAQLEQHDPGLFNDNAGEGEVEGEDEDEDENEEN